MNKAVEKKGNEKLNPLPFNIKAAGKNISKEEGIWAWEFGEENEDL